MTESKNTEETYNHIIDHVCRESVKIVNPSISQDALDFLRDSWKEKLRASGVYASRQDHLLVRNYQTNYQAQFDYQKNQYGHNQRLRYPQQMYSPNLDYNDAIIKNCEVRNMESKPNFDENFQKFPVPFNRDNNFQSLNNLNFKEDLNMKKGTLNEKNEKEKEKEKDIGAFNLTKQEHIETKKDKLEQKIEIKINMNMPIIKKENHSGDEEDEEEKMFKKNDLSERDLKMEEKVYQPNEEENKEEIKDNKSSDGESLGSADDVSDQSFGMDSSESNDILYCYYEKVNRTGEKWKVTLKDIIAKFSDKEYLYGQLQGEFNFMGDNLR